jgi:FtsZ-binding cell division protein ZapB
MKILKEKIKKTVEMVYFLKEENKLLKEKIKKNSDKLKFLEKENEKARKLIKENEVLYEEKKEIKERMMDLLGKMEKFKI